MAGIVTLLTDFGMADYFVGAMKGVMLSHNPRLRLVDITHDIPPQDIAAAAFQLLAVYGSFPAGTVHLVVVDPGVGSPRRPIACATGSQFYVGPDNGVFSRVWEREGEGEVRTILGAETAPVSSTFHGRDVFAPAAARLATGTPLDHLGPPVRDPVRLPSTIPRALPDGSTEGVILHIDRFGNCITSLTLPELVGDGGPRELQVGDRHIREHRQFYAEDDSETPFLIEGSAGFIEISINGGSAAGALGLERGDSVLVRSAG